MLINTLNHSVYQRFVMILLINTLFSTVDQHYYHRLLINSVGVSVDQRIVFERRNTWIFNTFILYIYLFVIIFNLSQLDL